MDELLSGLNAVDRDRLSELAVFVSGETVQRPVVYGLWQRTAELASASAETLLDRLVVVGLVEARPGGVVLSDPVRELLIAELGHYRLGRLHSMLLESVAVGLPRTDQVLFKPNTRAWWELDRGQRYMWDHAIAHMVAAADGGVVAEVVACDIRWIERQLLLHGPAAVSRDLMTVGTRRAMELREEWDRAAPLLGPTEPAESVLDVMRSRLADAGTLTWQIDEMPVTRARLVNEVGLPDWPQRNNPPVTEITGVAIRGESLLAVHVDGEVSSSTTVYPHGTRLFAESVGLNGVALAPDGASMVLACADGSVRQRRVPMSPVLSMAHGLHNYGAAIASDATWIATSGHDGAVGVWGVDGRQRAALSGHEGAALAVAVAPDGGWLVSGGRDATVRFWTPQGRALSVARGHGAPVELVRIAPDGSWVVSVDIAGGVRLWSADGSAGAILAGQPGSVRAVAVAADSTWLATGGADGRVWQWAADGTAGPILDGHVGSVDHVVIAPDGTWLATGGADGTVRIWNADGTSRAVCHGVRGEITGLLASPDSGWLAATGRLDQSVRMWNPDGTVRAELDGHLATPAMAVAPDGAWLATVDGWIVQQWTPAGRPARRYEIPSTMRAGIAVAPTGDWMLITQAGGFVILPTDRVPDGSILRGHTGAVHAVAHTGTWIASAGADATVRTWSTDGSPRQILEGHDGPVLAVAADAAHGLVVSGGADGTVRTWPTDNRPGPVLRGHAGPVRAVAITADGTRIFSGSTDGTIRAWAADGTPLATLTGHTDTVTALAVAPDGSWLASTGHDATIRIWDTRPPYTCLATMRVTDRLNACTIHTDGTGLIAGGRAGVYAFRLDGARP